MLPTARGMRHSLTCKKLLALPCSNLKREAELFKKFEDGRARVAELFEPVSGIYFGGGTSEGK